MNDTQKAIIQTVYAKNHASGKKCVNCIYYIAEYKDDYTLRHFSYGETKILPACSFAGHFSFVSHNPARLCRWYKENRSGNANIQP